MGNARDAELAAAFREHYPWLRGLAYVMLGDEGMAEEVSMDAFVKVFSTGRRFATIEWPRAYLRQTAINLIRSRLRRAAVEERALVYLHRQEAGTTRADEEIAQRMDVWSAILDLPDRQRLCVALRYLEDLTEPQIAELLQCSTGTVKSQLSKARTKLERMLRPTVDRETWHG